MEANWAMAITGNVCISRGISIQSPECFITHAIYGPFCASNYKTYIRYLLECAVISVIFQTILNAVRQRYIQHKKSLILYVKWNNLQLTYLYYQNLIE